LSAVADAAQRFPTVACYTVNWWQPEGEEGRLGLPYAFPASDACLKKGVPPKEWSATSLLDVLTRRHTQDTWFQAVHWPGRRRWPRLAKAILLDEDRDDSAGLAYVVVDLDRPDHTRSPWGTVEEAAEAVRETAVRLDCSVYATRGGLRALWVLETLVPLDLAQSYLNGFHSRLPDGLPVDPDKGVKDWTRGFRVPWCPRADGKVAPWGRLAPPMDLGPMLDGQVLRWDASDLQNETLVRMSPVDWRVETPHDRNTKRVAGWFGPQLEELQNASSRHAVLIAKARALGGLCRGAIEIAREPGPVDPEPFLRALITATDTTNAERTARWALDCGAHEPWWFEVDEAPVELSSRRRPRLELAPPPEENTPPDSVYEAEAAAEAVSGRAGEAGPAEDPPELDEACLRLDYTDLGNARRFAQQFRCEVRWCQAKDNWLVWQGSHWDWDERMGAQSFAQQTVDRIRGEAREWWRQVSAEADPEKRAKLEKRAEAAFKHYLRSQASGRIEAILRQAKALPGLPVSTEDFDTDPWLLTVENGTIDLRSQTCRSHRREDLINRVAPVAHDPAATCPTWDRFVAEVFPDAEVRGFVQRAIGYSLTGDISEQLWFLLQGEGSNGKSTLLEVIGALLGAYSATLPQGYLEERDFDPHPTENVGLYRARFASGTEPRHKRAWAAERIKRQTGGDIIEARFMHGDFFYFPPTHKLWVSVNDMPKTDDMGTGFWRRVVIIPFTQRWYREDEEGTPKVDQDLPVKLKRELPGILNWALDGLRQKLEGGLRIPNACRLAVNAYREEQDEVGRFLHERCEVTSPATGISPGSTLTSALYAAYRRWREGEGLDGRALSNVQFGKQLTARKFLAFESGGRTKRAGIKLKPEPTDEDDAQGGGGDG
jgi:putative DNA primase/helicase